MQAKVVKNKVDKRKLIKKRFFYFGVLQNSACLYLRKSYTNVFLTLTDLRNNVIICKTSGSSGIKGSKRRKRIPQALENIVKSMITYFSLYNIKSVNIVLKMRLNVFFHYLLKELIYYNIDINSISIKRKVAFNGTRGRKLRSV